MMSRSGGNLMVVESGVTRHSCDKHARDRPSGGKKKQSKRPDSATSLEILPPEGDDKKLTKARSDKNHNSQSNGRPSSSHSDSNSRPSSSNSHRRAPPLLRPDSATRRTPTPTKQIALQAVRRKTEREGDFGAFDWSEHEQHTPQKAPVKSRTKDHRESHRPSTHPSQKPTSKHTTMSQHSPSHSLYSQTTDSMATGSTVSMATSVVSSDSSDSLGSQQTEEELGAVGGLTISERDEGKEVNKSGATNMSNNRVNIEDSDEFDTDLEDDEEDSTSSEEIKIKAPNQLLMEFLECVMQKDYSNAKKLCQMILIYEPDNPEALNFQSVIDEKLQIDADAEAEGSGDTDSDDEGDEDNEDDDEDEGDSDDESDDDDDDDDSDDDSSEDEESEENDDKSEPEEQANTDGTAKS